MKKEKLGKALRDYLYFPSLDGEPIVQECSHDISLHFGIEATQSKMRKSDPSLLLLGYTRTMMGFLLLQPKPERVAMVGLGGGSLAKYCLRHVPDIHFTAVEINPDVIALRDKFEIPPDGPNFEVVCGDGAVYVANRGELVDVLLVDGFDREGLPQQLSSIGFYNDCYEKLRDGGVMAVNLWGGDIHFDRYCERIRECFDDQVIVVDSEDWGNKIVFAYKGQNFPPSASTLRNRTRALDPLHTVALRNTAQKMIKELNQRKYATEYGVPDFY